MDISPTVRLSAQIITAHESLQSVLSLAELAGQGALTRDQSEELKTAMIKAYGSLTQAFPALKMVRKDLFKLLPANPEA